MLAQKIIKQYFKTPENDALERMIQMKSKLRVAGDKEFWTILMREMTSIAGAQCGFVAKRILVDADPNGALVEHPALGEEGSCLMGTGERNIDVLSEQQLTHFSFLPQRRHCC